MPGSTSKITPEKKRKGRKKEEDKVEEKVDEIIDDKEIDPAE